MMEDNEMRKLWLFPLIALSLLFLVPQAHADDVAMALATGSQTVTDPPGGVETDGTCRAYFQLMMETGIKYKVECFNLTGAVQSHIHMGRAQEGGRPIVFLFGPQDPTGEINGTLSSGMLTGEDIVMEGKTLADLMDMIRSDQTYFNVHTEAHPSNEVRGQVTMINDRNVVGDLYAALATGSQVIAGDNFDGVATDASCMANFRVTDTGLKYKLKCWNITGITRAHIHMGSASENGPHVVFLFDGRENPTGDINGTVTNGENKGKGTLRSEDLIGELSGEPISALVEQLRNDNAYINVHTEANGPGEVRGHITFVDSISF